jgi:hypothetical protein
MKQATLYKKRGQVGATGALIGLIVGVGVATLVLIFVGALGGQTYNLVEDDLDAINDTAIKTSVKAGIASAFEAQEQTGSYMPIIVLAVVIGLVLTIILGLGGMNGGSRGGSVL